jgi:hypothetical protein
MGDPEFSLLDCSGAVLGLTDPRFNGQQLPPVIQTWMDFKGRRLEDDVTALSCRL